MTESTQQPTTLETSSQQTPAQEAQSALLNLGDLTAIRNILDVASQRGAFKAGELEAVGKVYNKLSAFLDSATKSQEA